MLNVFDINYFNTMLSVVKKNAFKKCLFILPVLLISACSMSPQKETGSIIESESDIEGEKIAIIPPPVETQVFYMKPVVKKLLIKAKLKFDEKDFHSAVSLLEQAIDISPNNPYSWQQLALVRLEQQNYSQAEQLAVKSNVLGESNDELRMKNWQIIAKAKRAQQSVSSDIE